MSTAISNLTKHIILKRKQSFTRSMSAGPMLESASLPTLAEPKLEVAELTSAEADDLHRDPEVLVVATPMPLKLIEPKGNAEPNPSAREVRGESKRSEHTPARSMVLARWWPCWIPGSTRLTWHSKASNSCEKLYTSRR